MFFLYGAQGPTAFSNGPSCLQLQGDWIVDTMTKLRDENIKYIDATHQAEQEWRQKVTDINDKTLFPGTSSWYMGANIPGKPREQLCYAGLSSMGRSVARRWRMGSRASSRRRRHAATVACSS